jgi:hypothetical protein
VASSWEQKIFPCERGFLFTEGDASEIQFNRLTVASSWLLKGVTSPARFPGGLFFGLVAPRECSATLIGRRLGALGLLCGGGLALLLPLSILRWCRFFSCHTVHRFGRWMLIDFCRTSASRLAGVAGRGAGASILTAGVAGTGVCGTNAQHDCGKACETDLFRNHYASPWFPSFDE